MKKVVFLFPNLAGHLNPSIQIAESYKRNDFCVYYACTSDIIPFVKKNGFEYYELNSVPFASSYDDVLNENKKEKWLEILIDRFSDKIYKQRKHDIEKMLVELEPECIFLDEFNFSDFILIHSFNQSIKVVLLQNKFPMYYNEVVPPLNTFAFPGKNTKRLWQLYFLKRRLRLIWTSIKYFGRNDLQILKKKFRSHNLPAKYSINIDKAFLPTFYNLEEWFLVPEKLDFKQQKLFAWQKYISPAVDFERSEEISEDCRKFVDACQTGEGNRLIYCSLGSVLTAHSKGKEEKVISFFYRLVNIAKKNSNYYVCLCAEKKYHSQLQVTVKNLLILSSAPQLFFLKNADLFITHGGTNSIIEAEKFRVKQMVIILNSKWDHNGNAARVLYYNLGRKLDLTSDEQKIEKAITDYLEEKGII
jgi:UDP:flavonoid glycosyltransferase YjiC (YdhE family)